MAETLLSQQQTALIEQGLDLDSQYQLSHADQARLATETADNAISDKEIGELARMLQQNDLTDKTYGVKTNVQQDHAIEIHRSVGAAAKNYPVRLLDSRQHAKLSEGQKIKGTAFAGKGTNKEIRDRFRLEAMYHVPASEWQKVSGNGVIVVGGKNIKAELHWYEANGEVYEMKVKRYIDEG